MRRAPLERLTNTEVHPPPARLRLAVHQQVVDGVQLIADIETKRTDRRLIPEPDADRVTQIVEPNAAGFGPHVAAVVEEHRAVLPGQRGADFFGDGEHAVAANRHAGAERAHLVTPPAADARGAAEKVLLRERDIHLIE